VPVEINEDERDKGIAFALYASEAGKTQKIRSLIIKSGGYALACSENRS
jgi:hypothetical protein